MSDEVNDDVEIFTVEWKSIFFPEVRFVGAKPDKWGRNGRLLLALGRTEEEAIMLSRNKVHGGGIWRLASWIKEND